MNKLCCLILLIGSSIICNAQNLVPNGDFEQYSVCPSGNGELYKALFWINPGLSFTPDYYNQCSINPDVDVPDNVYGFQPAHSGVAYAGIYLIQPIFSINVREYAEVQLTSSLVANSLYHFEMYVNLFKKIL